MPRPSLPLRLSALAALLAASATLLAQLAATPADPRYRIEIIIYAHVDADRNEEDFRHGRPDGVPAPPPARYRLPPLALESLFAPLDPGETPTVPGETPTVPGEPSTGPGGDPLAPVSAGAGDRLELIETAPGTRPEAGGLRAGSPRLPDGFRILGAEELELTDEAAQQSRGRYRLLGHVGWEQTGVDSTRSVPVDLARLGITNPTGTIEFHIGRFRHAILDLVYRDGRGSFWTADPVPGLTPLAYAESYRLQHEEEAITTLAYVDHPLFGVLIWITRAPDPAPETETPAGDTPGGPAA